MLILSMIAFILKMTRIFTTSIAVLLVKRVNGLIRRSILVQIVQLVLNVKTLSTNRNFAHQELINRTLKRQHVSIVQLENYVMTTDLHSSKNVYLGTNVKILRPLRFVSGGHSV